MIENTIQDWLAEYAELDSEDFEAFVTITCNSKDVISAVYTVLEDRQKYSALIDAVCNTLFGFYRSKRVDLQRFTLIFVPTLIYVYLNAVAHGEKKSCRGIEALLVGIYNLEAVDDNGQASNVSFRLPSLAQSSIYHEPMSLAPASLTESALRRLEECEAKLVRWGPLPQVDRVIAQNRLVVVTALLFAFNKHIASLHSEALYQLCKVASKLVSQGFSKPGKRVSYSSDVTPVLPRIPVTQPFLLELLHSLYYSFCSYRFNGHDLLALQAVEEIHQRACYQGYSDVIIVTNAIKSSTHHIHPGQSSDGTPMGINMAISPATPSATVSKSMITNASFRTKKLPEDIPIQLNKSEGDSSGLGSITEEKEDGLGRIEGEITGHVAGGPRRSLPKMAVSFGKKTRERLARVSHKNKLVNGGPNDQSQEHSLDDDADSGLSEIISHEPPPPVPTMQIFRRRLRLRLCESRRFGRIARIILKRFAQDGSH